MKDKNESEYELYTNLCDLAGEFRANLGNPEKQNEIVKEYREVLSVLGWENSVDVECGLPSEFMPEEYMKLHPRRKFTEEEELEGWCGYVPSSTSPSKVRVPLGQLIRELLGIFRRDKH